MSYLHKRVQIQKRKNIAFKLPKSLIQNTLYSNLCALFVEGVRNRGVQ